MNYDVVNAVTKVMSLLIQSGTLIGLLYALWKFLSAPAKAQDNTLLLHEKRLDAIEQRLDDGSERFELIDKGTSVTQSALLAIMDTLLNGDAKEELRKARNDLYESLAKK